MQIDIKQENFSFVNEYRIYVNERLSYIAKRHIFSFFLSNFNLFREDGMTILLSIHQKFKFFLAHYIIKRNNKEYVFRTIGLWSVYYVCEVENDRYEIYPHKGRKISIYKNGSQIGYYDQNLISFFEGDKFTFIGNNNIDKELIISFLIIIDNHRESFDNRNLINFNFGNLFFEEKAFNQNWQPNN